MGRTLLLGETLLSPSLGRLGTCQKRRGKLTLYCATLTYTPRFALGRLMRAMLLSLPANTKAPPHGNRFSADFLPPRMVGVTT